MKIVKLNFKNVKKSVNLYINTACTNDDLQQTVNLFLNGFTVHVNNYDRARFWKKLLNDKRYNVNINKTERYTYSQGCFYKILNSK